MIDSEVVEQGLCALSVAAGELIEAHHDGLVSVLPASIAERRSLFDALFQLGADLTAIARAADVLIGKAEWDTARTAI